MNEKDIYKLLNNMDMEDEIKEFEDISEIEKERIKSNIKKDKRFNKNYKKKSKHIAVAAASLIILSSINTTIPKTIYAKTISTLDSISVSISQALNINKNISDYATTVDKVIENEGVNIKLSDVIIDDNQLIITSLIEVEDESVDGVSFDYDIKINGKKVKEESSVGSIGKLDNKNIYSDVRYIDLKDKLDQDSLQKDKLNISLSTNKVYLNKENTNTKKKVTGNWEYNFTSSSLELRQDTKSLDINEIFTIGQNEYEIEKIVINPINQIIKAKGLNTNTLDSEIKLEGIDEKGNKVEFDLSSFDEGELVFKYNNYSKDLRLDFEELKLNIYTRRLPKESGKLTGEWEKLDKEIVIKNK